MWCERSSDGRYFTTKSKQRINMNFGSTQARSLTQFLQTDKRVTMSSHTHACTHVRTHTNTHTHTHTMGYTSCQRWERSKQTKLTTGPCHVSSQMKQLSLWTTANNCVWCKLEEQLCSDDSYSSARTKFVIALKYTPELHKVCCAWCLNHMYLTTK